MDEEQLSACAYLRIKKLSPEATLPRRNTPTDAGLDLFCIDAVIVKPKSRVSVPTGISMEIPEGFYGRVAPKSGLADKNGIDTLAGVVDSAYRGEVRVILYNTSDEDCIFEPKSKIAQLIIEAHFNFPVVEVDTLTETERGENGFGSSGSK